MEELIFKCMNGESTFEQFVAETYNYWLKTAKCMLRKWDHPDAIEPEDLVQEMLLSAWKSIGTADASKGNLKRWVVTGAFFTARRWLHCQRGANGFARNAKGSSSLARHPMSEREMMRRCGNECTDLLDQIAASVQSPNYIAPQEEAIAILESMQFAQRESDKMALNAMMRSCSVEEATIDFAMQRAEVAADRRTAPVPGNAKRRNIGWNDEKLDRERRLYRHALCRIRKAAVNV